MTQMKFIVWICRQGRSFEESAWFVPGIAAVTDDAVVLFGNSNLTALSLEDGSLLWNAVIREGQVCGNPAVTRNTVTLPTSAPALETFELKTVDTW